MTVVTENFCAKKSTFLFNQELKYHYCQLVEWQLVFTKKKKKIVVVMPNQSKRNKCH